MLYKEEQEQEEEQQEEQEEQEEQEQEAEIIVEEVVEAEIIVEEVVEAEENIVDNYTETIQDYCLICNRIVNLNESYLIEIENTHINTCEKCHKLSEIEIIGWFNNKCIKYEKSNEITIKYKKKNYIYVKYVNEDLTNAVNRFMKLIGLKNNDYNYNKLYNLIKTNV